MATTATARKINVYRFLYKFSAHAGKLRDAPKDCVCSRILD